jgi:hypothetical protein
MRLLLDRRYLAHFVAIPLVGYRQTRATKEFNINEGADCYYCAFDQLDCEELEVFRGRYRPGEKPLYLPEVHWEVWESGDNDATRWHEKWHAELVEPHCQAGRYAVA